MSNGVIKTILAAAVMAGLNAFINFVETDKKKKNNPVMEVDDDGLDFPLICPRCGDTMRYLGMDKWICPGCDNSAEREDPNEPEEIYFQYNESDDYAHYYGEPEDDDDIPEGCAACGGDYPNCCSSCNLMSD